MNKLKRFNLTNNYWKKGKNGKIELPDCCICLSEIAKGKETVLLPCGHMFHWKCCLNWLKKIILVLCKDLRLNKILINYNYI